MPLKNHFRHQQYLADEPKSVWRFEAAEFPAQQGSDAFADSLSTFTKSVDENVDAIWFVHGTFAGHDVLGWFGQLERVIPSAGSVLKTFGKKLTDAIAGDSGNFTHAFIDHFHTRAESRRFVWSGENTHSGRCKAAIELLDELLQRVGDEPRVMLWGHSHAGNIAALITNLIGAEPAVRDRFLDLAEPLFPVRDDRVCALQRVRAAFDTGAVEGLRLDIVNFGAPVCYGWDSAGYRSLRHIVNHSPQAEQPEWLSPLFGTGKKFVESARGDLIQLLGITGSDFLPWLLNRTTRAVEIELHRFLAPDYSRRDWWPRAKLGMRVADEGETVLVKYDNRDGYAAQTFGHSVYTRPEWLGFHLELVGQIYR
ncbi:hypothetical protein [Mariniblastus fucicola]|uniref:Alpha/beta hydrolase family protein n=1 Tax=Mariniblastus fucicola TaxID=980251 RepID=A0A5B9P2W1_9BACT|nr:hypothetical protein [Mariniblastus fucicola]QEG20494.1 hypothetical protein MFFC18_03420 [Mariniblastus fucicola]